MTRVPTRISVSLEYITLSWPDGMEQRISLKTLRTNCPCADCREERENKNRTDAEKPCALKIITAGIEEQLKLVQLRTVGNYAISAEWGDGHQAGIYTFEMLARL